MPLNMQNGIFKGIPFLKYKEQTKKAPILIQFCRVNLLPGSYSSAELTSASIQ